MKKILYLGLELPQLLQRKEVTHCPLIEIIPYKKDNLSVIEAFMHFKKSTHLLFTSKSAVSIFIELGRDFEVDIKGINQKKIIAIGKKTEKKLRSFGVEGVTVAQNETSEGVIVLLNKLMTSFTFLLWPHSDLSRPVIVEGLKTLKSPYFAASFYTTIKKKPLQIPELLNFDEIVFTSPSTVDAIYKKIPDDKILTCIGPVTKNSLIKAQYL